MPPPDEHVPTPPEKLTPEPGPPADSAAGACPRCGSPYAPGQEYCLECGLRLPLVRGFVAANLIPALASTWRRHARWDPGDWIWPVVFGLVVAIAGATVAILVTTSDNEKRGGGTIIATTNTGSTSTTTTETVTTGATSTETTTETTPTTTEPPPSPPPPPPPSGPIKWPAGKTGFTVILASVAQSDGLASARKPAQKALDAGLTDVGVLNSSNYSSLKPGYYVVFSGVFDTLAEAESNLSTATSTFAQAYTRKIVP